MRASRERFPRQTRPNVANSSDADSELPSKRSRAARVRANAAHVLRRQLRPGVALATLAGAAPLNDHIAHVLGVRPKEEMARVNACAHVAFMANAKTLRNGANQQKPRC